MGERKEFIVADSGDREQHSTGAVRDIRQGKGRFDLVTPVALRRLAKVYEKGADKYAERNWEKGMPLSRFIDSASRHINDYLMIALFKREEIPLETLPVDVNPNEDHLAQAAWNLFCVMHHEDLNPELDDLNKSEEAVEAARQAFDIAQYKLQQAAGCANIYAPEPVQPPTPSTPVQEPTSSLSRFFHKN